MLFSIELIQYKKYIFTRFFFKRKSEKLKYYQNIAIFNACCKTKKENNITIDFFQII